MTDHTPAVATHSHECMTIGGGPGHERCDCWCHRDPMSLDGLAARAIARGESTGTYHHRAVLQAIDAARALTPAQPVTETTDLCRCPCYGCQEASHEAD